MKEFVARPEQQERIRKWEFDNRAKRAAQARERRAKNKEDFRKQRKEYWHKVKEGECLKNRCRKHGITIEAYNQILKSQNGCCAICDRKFDKTQHGGPHIDHCHNTKIFRGLICSRCNLAEGHLRTPEKALKLYQYMLKNELFYQGKN